MVSEHILSVDRVSVVHPAVGRHEPTTAVNDVTLTADEGEVVGLVGESGSGKSSLAMAIAGLGRHTAGTIDVAGIQPGPHMSRDDRASIQMVFQDPHGSLDPRQTIRSGLNELRTLHRKRTSWISNEELLDRVGLQTALLTRLPHQISGGQAQRVSIARALLLRPRLLLADEPTSGLDVSVQAQIIRLLNEIREMDKLTILFISHDLSVVRTLCDRVYVMKEGIVVEDGATQAVLHAPEHPYTRRLLSAVPGSEQQRARESRIPAPSVNDSKKAVT